MLIALGGSFLSVPWPLIGLSPNAREISTLVFHIVLFIWLIRTQIYIIEKLTVIAIINIMIIMTEFNP